MRIQFFFTFIFFLTVLGAMEAQQKFRFQTGVHVGASKLYHNTRFESTRLNELYSTIALTHKPKGSYTWEQFEKDFDLRKSFIQPRFAAEGILTYGDLPFFVMGEVSSSSSSYQQPMYAVTVGLGKDFLEPLGEFYFSAYGGFKHVFLDKGFGAETLVNSIGDQEARELVATYFNPEKTLGPTRANLITARGGIGMYVSDTHQTSIGAEFYGELDLTNETRRQARMNVVGVQAYVRFYLFNPPEEDIKKI